MDFPVARTPDIFTKSDYLSEDLEQLLMRIANEGKFSVEGEIHQIH